MRLHDLEKHFFIVQALSSMSSGFSINKVDREADLDEIFGNFEETGDMDYLKSNVRRVLKKELVTGNMNYLSWKEIHFHDSDKKKKLFYRNRLKIKSSHYELLYFIDPDRKFIHFNFSIPKYLYGNNIMQFAPHDFTDPDFNMFFCKSFAYQRKIAFKRLRNFIDFFFKKEVLANLKNDDGTLFRQIDFTELEIFRLDLTWNQVFETKEHALEYLEYQKKIKPPFSRKGSNIGKDWWTSVVWKSRDKSIKIYHKGTEYASKEGDKKRHKLINKKLGYEHFKVEELQAFADRILRYEMTCRFSYMSYLYQRNLFRKDCQIHQKLVKDSKVGKAFRKIVNSENPEHIARVKKIGFPTVKKYLNDYKLYERIIMKHRTVRMALTPEQRDYNLFSHTFHLVRDELHFKHNEIKFSNSLLQLMFDRFESFINHFEVKSAPSVHEMVRKIEQHNDSVELRNQMFNDKKPQIRESKIKNLMALMKNYTMEEIKQMGLVSRTTIWRYEKQLKQFNFARNTMLLIHIPNDHKNDWYNDKNELVRQGQGFEWYYNHILFNPALKTFKI